MEIARCPGCGASVRPKAAWCSLCYHDLHPEPAAAHQMAGASSGAAAGSPPLVEAALEPGPAELSATAGFNDTIVDAEIVDAEIVDAAAAGEPAVDKPRGSGAWPCTCGTPVPLEHNACPACGRSFLEELRELPPALALVGVDNGRHRRGGRFARAFHDSRAFRLGVGMFVAAVFAVGVPMLLTLFG